MTPVPLLIGFALSLSSGMARAEESLETSSEGALLHGSDLEKAAPAESPPAKVPAPPPPMTAAGDAASQVPSAPPTAQNFADYREQILSNLSRAARRIWLLSGYITDGDIVSALYVAKYRKIDVKVLLGKGRANSYMSRLQYLKSQGIPVYLKPDSLVTSRPTMILVDDTLVLGASDLDFMTRSRDFSLSFGGDEARARFEKDFGGAFDSKIPANAAALPLVGRPGRNKSAPAPRSPLILAVPQAKHQDAPGVYQYRRQKDPRPDGVPARLPRGLKWEKRAAQEEPMIVPSAPRPAPHVGGG